MEVLALLVTAVILSCCKYVLLLFHQPAVEISIKSCRQFSQYQK